MSQPAPRNRTGNRLLDGLPPDESDRLLALAEPISLRHLEQLFEQDGPLPHVYFPKSGVLSSVISLGEGRVVEAATIGNEGMVGIPALLGLDFATATATAQVPGDSLRIPTPSFVEAMSRGGPLDLILRRYIAFSLRSAYQAVACNALHSMEERMARWLLTTQDRVGSSEFLLTQEFLAQMLGGAPPERPGRGRHVANGGPHHLPAGPGPGHGPGGARSLRLRVLRDHQVALRPHRAVTTVPR
jgi:CRP-like cAMP-binding protein